MSLALLINPFLSAFVATIYVIGQLFYSAAASLSRTVFCTLQFLLLNFCRHWSCSKNSLTFDAHISTVYVNKCLVQQRYGITTLDFKVNRFIRLNGTVLLTSLNNFTKSVVKRREFAIAWTSISNISNDSSFRLVPWEFNEEDKMVVTLLIFVSHNTPSIFLAEGGFHFHSIHSPPWSLMKSLIFCYSISTKTFLNLEEAPRKWLLLSDLRSVMFNLWPTYPHKCKMNESVFS